MIRKLTNRAMRSDKARNTFVIIAIALTALMITSVFSLGISYFESLQMQAMRSQGSTSHFAFFAPTEEQMDKLLELDYIRHVGVAATFGEMHGFEQFGGIQFGFANRIHWDKFFLPVYTNVVGRYAEAENEVMISRHVLGLMGIENPYIGMEIPLTFTHLITGEQITDVFVLSKTFTDQSLLITTSLATAERLGATALDNTAINVIFRNSNRIAENAERLISDLAIPAHDRQFYTIAPAFDGNMGRLTTYVGLAAIIGFIMLASYLLIYNVMYMSVSRDVRFYGLLKTLGTTAKQIRRIVVGQSLRLCMIGVPLGLVIAALVSFIIVPLFVESGIDTEAVVSFSPIIFIGGTIFTILTVYVASLTPAKKAAMISPIESTRFVGESQAVKAYGTRTHGKPVKMAIRNIFREPKRAKLTILSLFIGITVFTSVATFTNSFNIDYNLNRRFSYDFTVVSARRSGVLNWESVNRFRSQFGDGAEVFYLIYSEFSYPHTSQDFSLRSVGTQMLIEVYERHLFPQVNLEVIDIALTPENIAAFERGEIAFLSISSGDFSNLVNDNTWVIDKDEINRFPVGSVLTMYIGEDKVPAEIVFGGFVAPKMPPYGWSTTTRIPQLLVSNAFMEGFISPEHAGNFDSVEILSINFNATTANEETYYRLLNSILSPNEQMVSRLAARRFYEDVLSILFIIGGGLGGILALIGAFNFVNVMSASAIARKREFAILESVGMSKRQMRKTIKFEGLGYWVITVLLSATVGSLIAYALMWFVNRLDSAFNFNFPLVPVLAIYAAILAICLIVPELVYRSMSKATLVERLREAE